LAFSASIHAVPTLDFIGGLAFDSTADILTIIGQINGVSSEFNAIEAELLNSSLVLSVELASVTGNTVTNPLPPFDEVTTIVADFNSGTGTDLQITKLATTWLVANVVDPVIMAGTKDRDFGDLNGEFLPTAGDLLSYFTLPSSIFALEVSLTNPFSLEMFDSDFTGDVNGSVAAIAGNPSAIPEPPVWALFAVALTGLITFRQSKPSRSNQMR